MSGYCAAIAGINVPEDEMNLLVYSSSDVLLGTKLMGEIKTGSKIIIIDTIDFIAGLPLKFLMSLGSVFGIKGAFARAAVKIMFKLLLGFLKKYAAKFLAIAALGVAISIVLVHIFKPRPDPDRPDEINLSYKELSTGAIPIV